MISKRATLLFGSLLFFVLQSSAEAYVNIVAAIAPAPREVILPPPGYVSCYTIPSGYYNGMWVNQYNECRYDNSPGVWVSAHWECNRFNPAVGACRHWRWRPSYWSGPQMAGPAYLGPPAPYVAGPPVYVNGPTAAIVVGGPGPYYHHHRHWRY